MNFLLKTRNCISKTRDFGFKMILFAEIKVIDDFTKDGSSGALPALYKKQSGKALQESQLQIRNRDRMWHYHEPNVKKPKNPNDSKPGETLPDEHASEISSQGHGADPEAAVTSEAVPEERSRSSTPPQTRVVRVVDSSGRP